MEGPSVLPLVQYVVAPMRRCALVNTKKTRHGFFASFKVLGAFHLRTFPEAMGAQIFDRDVCPKVLPLQEFLKAFGETR